LLQIGRPRGIDILPYEKIVVSLHSEKEKNMCTFNVSVDEAKLANKYPGIDSERFGRWLQGWVDDILSDDTPEAAHPSPNAHAYEDMKSAIRQRIDSIEAGKATFHSNEEVFSIIRKKYDL